MLKMNYWTDKWDLHEDVCPCDVHFNDWVAKEKLKNKQIYHFGSGTHHVVGVEAGGAEEPHAVHHGLQGGVPGVYRSGHHQLRRRQELRLLFR